MTPIPGAAEAARALRQRARRRLRAALRVWCLAAGLLSAGLMRSVPWYLSRPVEWSDLIKLWTFGGVVAALMIAAELCARRAMDATVQALAAVLAFCLAFAVFLYCGVTCR
jgi:hypothetical protein